MSICLTLLAQEWAIQMETNGSWINFCDLISVDNGESVLGIGNAQGVDGFVAKVDKYGDYIDQVIHPSGMVLQYHSAVQLNNGNYMVFGICDDSLCDENFQKYLRIEVFNNQLEILHSKMYNVDDEVFDYFHRPFYGQVLKAIVTKSGTVVLASRPAYYKEKGHYISVIRFYEFDESGEIIRMVDNPPNECYLSSIKEITYAPHSDNFMIFIDGGWFGNASGVSGIFVVDTSLHVVARQSLFHLGGQENVEDNACEGNWFDDNHLIIDVEKYVGSSFTYHTLYNVDSALNIYASLRLPPYDSCTWVPYGTSTAYINDSTIFAFSYCSSEMWSFDMTQVNVILVDKHLNLLGRKTIQEEDKLYYCGPPASFNDGGCAILITSKNGLYYQGEPFIYANLLKFRREDIEITWDVVNEPLMEASSSAFPNPTSGIINIPIPLGKTTDDVTRIQIFDIKGMKSFDCAISKSGNLITIDTQNLESGLYIYKIVSENVILAEGKFIKE
jgi:hypothetical protein